MMLAKRKGKEMWYFRLKARGEVWYEWAFATEAEALAHEHKVNIGTQMKGHYWRGPWVIEYEEEVE
jgi:hypothetical protein